MSAWPTIGVSACRRVLDPHPFHMVGEKYLQALIDGANRMADGRDYATLNKQRDAGLIAVRKARSKLGVT